MSVVAMRRAQTAIEASSIWSALTDPGASWTSTTVPAINAALGEATGPSGRAQVYGTVMGALRQLYQAHSDNTSQIAMARSPAQRAAAGAFLLAQLNTYGRFEDAGLNV